MDRGTIAHDTTLMADTGFPLLLAVWTGKPLRHEDPSFLNYNNQQTHCPLILLFRTSLLSTSPAEFLTESSDCSGDGHLARTPRQADFDSPGGTLCHGHLSHLCIYSNVYKLSNTPEINQRQRQEEESGGGRGDSSLILWRATKANANYYWVMLTSVVCV